ncbi:MAG: thioredoxin domain-containing protein [Chloroflexi bacterium]|nr:thioredoxin domain-containing protein [Chloroflexota bacterium]
MAVAEGTLDTDTNGLTVGFTAEDGPSGATDAPVLIEEFSDYQCPYCARFFQQTLPSIEQNQIARGDRFGLL